MCRGGGKKWPKGPESHAVLILDIQEIIEIEWLFELICMFFYFIYYFSILTT